MRDLLFKCPSCDASLSFDRRLAGKTLSCPSCKGRIDVPIPDASFACPSCNTELHVFSAAVGEFECPACNGAIELEAEPAKVVSDSAGGAGPKLRLNDRQKEGQRCPRCGSGLDEDAVICVACGTDLRTGKPIQGPPVQSSREGSATPVGALSSILVWAIAVVPLLGSLIEWLAGPGMPWQAYFLTNCALCWIDDRVARKHGHETPGGGWAALIPVYLWKRATLFSHGWRSYFWAWTGAFLLSLAVDHHVGGVLRLEEAAAPVVTDILKENLGSDAKRAVVKLGKRQPDGTYLAAAVLDDGHRIGITIEEKGGQIEVTIPDLIQYLVAVKRAAAANPNPARVEQARKMVAAHSRALVKTAIAGVKDEDPTQDVSDIVESVVGYDSPMWPARAELFHDAGDDGPAEALSLYVRGVEAGARKDYRQAIDLYLRAMKKDAGSPWPFNNLAWVLATCPDTSLRNGPKAIDLAAAAIDMVGTEYWSFADTLAAACAESRDFEQALQWQQTAIDSAPPEQRERQQQRMETLKNRTALTDGNYVEHRPCAGCGEEIPTLVAACPHCGMEYRFRCPDCGRHLCSMDEEACPFCNLSSPLTQNRPGGVNR